MSTVNRNLLLSLTQDLKNLNNTQDKILSNSKSFELISWLYPTKQFWQVDYTLIDTAPESSRYTMTLEFIIDKIYLIINLMVNCVNDFQIGVTKEKLQKNIKCAQLTLGASIEMLWNKLECFKRLIISKSGSDLMRLESFTQTAEDSKFHPEPTTPFFKEITSVLLSHNDLHSLKEVKNKLQEDVYGLTEYSCVNKLTSALVEDFKRLVGHRNYLQNQNIKIHSKLKRSLLRYKKSMKRVENVMCSLRKVNRMYSNEHKRNKTLQVKLKLCEKNGNTQRNVIQEYEEKLKHLEQSFDDSCARVDSLGHENNALRNTLNQCALESDQLKEETLLWKNRFSEVYLENSKLVLSANFVKEANALENINNNCCLFLEKLDAFNITIDQRSQNFKDYVKMIADVADSQVIKDDRLRQQPSSFIVVGDPISDMRQQIKSNNNTIEELEKSNLKLLKMIKKIQLRTANVMML